MIIRACWGRGAPSTILVGIPCYFLCRLVLMLSSGKLPQANLNLLVCLFALATCKPLPRASESHAHQPDSGKSAYLGVMLVPGLWQQQTVQKFKEHSTQEGKLPDCSCTACKVNKVPPKLVVCVAKWSLCHAAWSSCMMLDMLASRGWQVAAGKSHAFTSLILHSYTVAEAVSDVQCV